MRPAERTPDAWDRPRAPTPVIVRALTRARLLVSARTYGSRPGRPATGISTPSPGEPAAQTSASPVAGGARRGAFWYVGCERLLVLSIAAGLTVALWERWPLAGLPILAWLVLAIDTTALPAYERATSLRPVRRLVSQSGAVLLVLAIGGWLTLDDLRYGSAAVLLLAAVPATARGTMLLMQAPSSTLLVGDRIGVGHLIAQWMSRPEVRLVGVCLTSTPDDSVDPVPDIAGVAVLGGLEDVSRLAVEHGVSQVVVAPGPVLSAYDVRRLSWALEDSRIELAVAAEVHGAVPRRIRPRLLGRRLLLSVRPARPPLLAVLVKDGLDRLVAALLLLLLAPMIVALIVAVRWDSAGPGIFRQVRVGKGGRRFTMYKLRSMRIDAELLRPQLMSMNEGAGLLFKLADDPRVTRLGTVLRRTSLDELPQLLNVVLGQMSLIGPRPALPSETDEYDDWIRRRLTVKPGMTGLWQVSGRSRLRWNESVSLDLDYVDNWTLRGDLEIASRTIGAVARSDGAQ
ncbi:MAG TPA: exopolysaccharide biosynthesis polyprenyl glycosylphosphotransferase [Nocardioidaceae bacterium]|nr:exopolysaccharide biosynthesis polyprenyl glycosylphosphotransferase [Nocardioidaceae bacterium]